MSMIYSMDPSAGGTVRGGGGFPAKRRQRQSRASSGGAPGLSGDMLRSMCYLDVISTLFNALRLLDLDRPNVSLTLSMPYCFAGISNVHVSLC